MHEQDGSASEGQLNEAERPDASPSPPATGDPEEWARYWRDRGQRWRRAPEIDEQRQRYLRDRLARADPNHDIHPFSGEALSRGDIEWLTALTLGDGASFDTLDAVRPDKALLGDLDLRGAQLQRAHLQGAHLSGAQLQGADLFGAHLQDAVLAQTQLQGAVLVDAQLQRAYLVDAHLEDAQLNGAHLEGAYLFRAHLEDAILVGSRLEGTILANAELQRADFSRSFLDRSTDLSGALLGDGKDRFASVSDVRWGDANLAVLDWTLLTMPWEEQTARRQSTNTREKNLSEQQTRRYQRALRANRQLAIALRAQGLNEDADRFAYRAQVLQRTLFWRRGRYLQWALSVLLAALAGYGYRLWRIVIAYACAVTVFALLYYTFGMYHAPRLSLSNAYLQSITAFHGRVFAEPFLSGAPQLWVTAGEAVTGLVIEGVFIAMLTQRILGR